MAIGSGGAFAVFSASGQEGECKMKAHLTLYAGGELLRDRGMVIMSSTPMPEAELRALTGDNPAADSPDNTTREQLNEGDILLGAYVTGRANFMGMYYPEGGILGFNFMVDPKEPSPKDLSTDRILIGSGR